MAVIPDDDADGRAAWVTGDYRDDDDPAGAAGARLIWLERQRRIADGWDHAPSGPSGRPAAPGWHPRNMTGADALAALERRAWLELTQAAGAVLDVEIEHYQ